jgi:hypothetical protein
MIGLGRRSEGKESANISWKCTSTVENYNPIVSISRAPRDDDRLSYLGRGFYRIHDGISNNETD